MGDLKYFGIRVFNRTKSCILTRMYDNGTVTIPILAIPEKCDPFDFLDVLLTQVDGSFEMVSAINILDFTTTNEGGATALVIHSVIYDIKYKGTIFPNIPSCCNRYLQGKWVPKYTLIKCKDINCTTRALVDIMEKENV